MLIDVKSLPLMPTLREAKIRHELVKSLNSGMDKESCYAMIEFKFDFGVVTEDNALLAMYILDDL